MRGRPALSRSFQIAVCATLALAAGVWEPSCDEVRGGGYRFAGLMGSKESPVEMSLCADPQCAQPRRVATVTEDTYSMASPASSSRPYFLLVRKGRRRVIGARRLVLEGAYNFRDLGGIAARDGRRVKWGQVFRSDALAQLTEADYARLNRLGIALVCDLRTREERGSAPTDWRKGSPVYVLAAVSEGAQGESRNTTLSDAVRASSVPVEEGRKLLSDFYVHAILDSATKFGVVLRAIETSPGASMFHCTGGRDRTGMTAALLLTILGVPEERIAQDYVASTQYLAERPEAAGKTEAEIRQARYRAEMMELQPRYLDAIFGAIREKYGSFDRYRREALGLSDADVEKLKARLLE